MKEKKLIEVLVLGSEQTTEIHWREDFPEPLERTRVIVPFNLNPDDPNLSLIAEDRQTGELYQLNYDRTSGYQWRIA